MTRNPQQIHKDTKISILWHKVILNLICNMFIKFNFQLCFYLYSLFTEISVCYCSMRILIYIKSLKRKIEFFSIHVQDFEVNVFNAETPLDREKDKKKTSHKLYNCAREDFICFLRNRIEIQAENLFEDVYLQSFFCIFKLFHSKQGDNATRIQEVYRE